MFVGVTLSFFIYFGRCICEGEIDVKDETLKPLKLPEKYDREYDTESVGNLFENLGINFFSSLPKIENSQYLYDMLKEIPVSSIQTQNACQSKQINAVLVATEQGEKMCQEICEQQNEAYAKYINGYFQKIISFYRQRGIAAAIQARNENVHKCISDLKLLRMNCACKKNMEIMVNEEFQKKVDAEFSENNIDVRSGEGSWILEMFGLWVVLRYAWYLTPFYLIWLLFFG